MTGTQNRNQGEGNVEAAKEYNESQRSFVESGRVDDAARKAKPRSSEEEKELASAEKAGRSRAKEEDPAITRRPGPPQTR